MIGVSNVTNRTDPSSLRSRVFVGNLNTLHMQKPELEAIFSKYGTIIGISVHKGYAFIQFANELHARTAACSEDLNSYYGMKMDITLASEPRNRKRGRSAAGPTAGSPPNMIDLALQTQALAAMGGQFSQLGFLNNNNSALPNQQQILGSLTSHAPLIGGQHVKSSGIRGHRNNPLLGSSFSNSSSAKRTRLESSTTLKSAPGLLSRAHSTNLVPLVTKKPQANVKSTSTTVTKLSKIKQNGVAEVRGSEDILICGQCHRLFDSVDVLIAHKMAGCPQNNCCRCKLAGEPASMDCTYCGETFISAWELISHCHTEHGLTIYALPSSSSSARGSVAYSPSPSEDPFSVTTEVQEDEEYFDDPITPQAEIEEEKEEEEEEDDDDENLVESNHENVKQVVDEEESKEHKETESHSDEEVTEQEEDKVKEKVCTDKIDNKLITNDKTENRKKE